MSAGRSIPTTSRARCRGGVAQGIGWALNEEYIYDKNGKLDNAGFLDYRMPVTSDLPKLDTVMIEIPNPKHPQGRSRRRRGAAGAGDGGRSPMPSTAPWVFGSTACPMSPPKVLDALDPEPWAKAAD